LLEKDPDARFATAHLLAEAMDAAMPIIEAAAPVPAAPSLHTAEFRATELAPRATSSVPPIVARVAPLGAEPKAVVDAGAGGYKSEPTLVALNDGASGPSSSSTAASAPWSELSLTAPALESPPSLRGRDLNAENSAVPLVPATAVTSAPSDSSSFASDSGEAR